MVPETTAAFKVCSIDLFDVDHRRKGASGGVKEHDPHSRRVELFIDQIFDLIEMLQGRRHISDDDVHDAVHVH